MKQQKNLTQSIAYWSKVSVIGIILGVSLQFVGAAWTEPVAAPPGGNLGAPLNTGGVGQSKAGGLILNTNGATNGLIVDKGNVSVTSLANCDTIDTDAYGKLKCGTDAAGSGGATGSGTANYITKWTNASTLGNSIIQDNGTNVGIGTAPTANKLEVWGNEKLTGTIGTNGFSPTDVPSGWGGGVTANDLVAKWSVRANQLCLGGGGGSTAVGDCRTTWPIAPTLSCTTHSRSHNINGISISYSSPDCPAGTFVTGGGCVRTSGGDGGNGLASCGQVGNHWEGGWFGNITATISVICCKLQ